MTNIVIRPLGTEFALTTANTVSNCDSAHLTNLNAGAALVTLANTTVTIGTFSMPTQTSLIVKKYPGETLSANVAVQAVPVAWY